MKFNKKDYEDFLNDSVRPPKGLSENVFKKVESDLNPSAWGVFSKLTLIHFFSALLTLSVCPQFGFRVFGSGHGLMGTFMNFGPHGCVVACGSLFLGSSFLIAGLALQLEEIKVLRKYRWIQIATLVSLSLGAFIMIGAEQILISFAAAWVVGTFLGALSALELGWLVKRKFAF